jgi:hypothetical protein
MLFVVGVIFLVAAMYDSVQSVRLGGWNWQYVTYEGTPAAMGIYLILLAFSTPNQRVGNAAVDNQTALPS